MAGKVVTGEGRQPKRRSLAAGLAGVVLLVLGGGAFVLGSRVSRPSAEVLRGDLPVDAEAGDRLDVSAHNSPKLVVNPIDPSNLAVANRVDSPKLSCALHTSFDGGATWTETATPSQVTQAGSTGCFSPDLAFGPDGILYLSFTSLSKLPDIGTAPDALWVAASADGGRSFSSPVIASGPLAFQARLTADPSKPGRVYLTWLQAYETGPWGFTKPGNPIVVARSNDGGRTWGKPVTVTPPQRPRVVAPALSMGQDGSLYLAYLDVGEDRLDYNGAHEGRGGDPYPGTWALVLARSSDAGVTWEEAMVDPGVVPTQRFLQLFPPTPSLATGPRAGHVFVAFHDARRGDADILLWRSEDGGRSWSVPARVNDTALGDGHQQYLPAVAASSDGRLDVVYYDRRSDPQDVTNEVSLQSSFDGGRSFGPRLKLSSRSFDSRIGIGAERGLPELGSRLGLASNDRGALAVWADTRAADPRTEKQDLTRSVVAISGPSPLGKAMGYGGAAMAVGGLVLLGVLAWRSTKGRLSMS